MAKGGKRSADPASGALNAKTDSFAAFNEDALNALTTKIEKGLGKSQPDAQAASRKPKQKQASNEGKSNGASSRPKPTKLPELVRGTKRDVRGNAKSNGKPVSQTEPDSGRDAAKNDREILLQEILALGGTEEDLDLVADAASDEEDAEPNTTKSHDKLLQKDLAKFVAGLGIEGAAVESDDGESVMAEDSEDEWEEASDQSSIKGTTKGKTTTGVLPVAPNPSTSELPSNPNRLIFEARPDWHAAPLADLPTPEENNSLQFRGAVATLKEHAKSLLQADGNLYASKHLSSSSSQRFLSSIMTSGTLSDKVSALTLVVQESPVHTTKSFESLLALAKKRSRAQAVTALGALKDLLGVGVVLPADRRLRNFASQPGLLGTLQQESVTDWTPGQKLPGKISNAHLVSWAYEEWLKEVYFDMLKVLEGWCNDEVEFARSKAVTYVYELLKEKPEQEANLLRLLVNKLGDPDKKIASRTSYLLLQLQTSHPLMKPVIVRSIENELLLRPGQSSHAKYYAINTLNQTILSTKEEEVAKKLLNIYFELFVSLLKKPEPAQMMGPAVNRKGQVQGGGAAMGKKAKARAAKEEEAKLTSEETTEKMISAVLTGVNRAFPFSKSDDVTLEKHMDTLFKITHSSNFNTSIQALMLIEQLATSKHLAVERFYRTLYESLLDPRLISSSKHALYLNLLFRALRADLNIKRVKAFVKRMLQIVSLHQPPFICGILFLVRELEITFPGLKSLFNDPEELDQEEEEVFRDVPDAGASELPTTDQNPRVESANTYDGRKRDPEHSNADKSCLWEIMPFISHFHPSVALFASRLVHDEAMPPKPDLASHTLTSFLDRFVYRNAKAAAGGFKGGSIMQPLSGGDSKGILLSTRSANKAPVLVNTEAFWRKKSEDVAADEVFFHKYFNHIGKSKQALIKGKVPKTTGGQDGEDNEDEDEDEIWQALVDSRPEVEGNEDSDSEMLGLDESDMESYVDDADVDVEGDEDVDIEGSEDAFDDPDLEGGDNEIESDIDELFAQELQTEQPQAPDKTEETSRQKKRKFKSLPTFASADDYAEMLDNDDDEDR